MPEKYTVQKGDCVLSIAAQRGLPWKRIWNHPDNAELRKLRKEPNILKAGDELVIPDKEKRIEKGATEKQHVFRMKRPWVEIRIRLLEFDVPRADEPFYVLVDGEQFDGESPLTDGEGLAVCRIPAGTESAILVVGEEETKTEYEVRLGHIDPIDTPEGKHTRLWNLGRYEAGIESDYDEETAAAMSEFLTSQGEPDPKNVDQPNDSENENKLKAGYGS